MNKVDVAPGAHWTARVRSFFVARDFIFHDGRDLRRFSIGGRTQAVLAGAAAITLGFSAFGVAQAAVGAVQATGLTETAMSPEQRVAAMQDRLQAMQAKVAVIKAAAQAHAARIDQRQALISAALSGNVDAARIAHVVPPVDASTNAAAADVIAPLQRTEQRQVAIAARARVALDQRLATTTGHLRRLGLSPERLASMPAMGGPYEPVSSSEASADMRADAQFRALFLTWKKLDTLEQAVIAIPSLQPIQGIGASQMLSFSSTFGIRTDPFRGTAAMHAGVDIPGPIGTPIYATADGTVDRAERAGGYGNLVELDHGKGIQTRYGHLSKILVEAGAHVKRGQLIALMGSTGRSTGSHLHYEVRLDGHAVNPMPFLQTADYLLAVQDRALKAQQVAAVGGPAVAD